jgi:hypothetical protein
MFRYVKTMFENKRGFGYIGDQKDSRSLSIFLNILSCFWLIWLSSFRSAYMMSKSFLLVRFKYRVQKTHKFLSNSETNQVAHINSLQK